MEEINSTGTWNSKKLTRQFGMFCYSKIPWKVNFMEGDFYSQNWNCTPLELLLSIDFLNGNLRAIVIQAVCLIIPKINLNPLICCQKL